MPPLWPMGVIIIEDVNNIIIKTSTGHMMGHVTKWTCRITSESFMSLHSGGKVYYQIKKCITECLGMHIMREGGREREGGRDLERDTHTERHVYLMMIKQRHKIMTHNNDNITCDCDINNN